MLISMGEINEMIIKLDKVIEILERVEARQIKTTAMVEEVKTVETEVGGFGKMES